MCSRAVLLPGACVQAACARLVYVCVNAWPSIYPRVLPSTASSYVSSILFFCQFFLLSPSLFSFAHPPESLLPKPSSVDSRSGVRQESVLVCVCWCVCWCVPFCSFSSFAFTRLLLSVFAVFSLVILFPFSSVPFPSLLVSPVLHFRRPFPLARPTDISLIPIPSFFKKKIFLCLLACLSPSSSHAPHPFHGTSRCPDVTHFLFLPSSNSVHRRCLRSSTDSCRLLLAFHIFSLSFSLSAASPLFPGLSCGGLLSLSLSSGDSLDDCLTTTTTTISLSLQSLRPASRSSVPRASDWKESSVRSRKATDCESLVSPEEVSAGRQCPALVCCDEKKCSSFCVCVCASTCDLFLCFPAALLSSPASAFFPHRLSSLVFSYSTHLPLSTSHCFRNPLSSCPLQDLCPCLSLSCASSSSDAVFTDDDATLTSLARASSRFSGFFLFFSLSRRRYLLAPLVPPCGPFVFPSCSSSATGPLLCC